MLITYLTPPLGMEISPLVLYLYQANRRRGFARLYKVHSWFLSDIKKTHSSDNKIYYIKKKKKKKKKKNKWKTKKTEVS